jgi:hypothetical protein
MFEVSVGQPTRTKDKEMLKLDSLQTKTNDELIDLIELDVLNYNDDSMVRRILKDRLEGLEGVVKNEVLANKIVGA